MKKLLPFFMLFLAVGAYNTANTQTVNSHVTGYVQDTGLNPVEGAAVFIYNITNNGHPDSDYSGYVNYTYTDSVGSSAFFLNYTAQQGDTMLVGVIDCNDSMYIQYCIADAFSLPCTTNFVLSCPPTACQAVLSTELDSAGTHAVFRSVSLINEAALPPSFGTQHFWSFSDNVNITHGPIISSNTDTVMRDLSTLPSNLEYCYKRQQGCGSVCDSTFIGNQGGNSLTCNASFYVDSINSTNYQGQIVLWENSTTSSNSPVSYLWDFGDGATSTNQYPTHTYNDTDIYNVCLTITTIDGPDTCTSTYCDSIGYDSNGNLVYKTNNGSGFTINVIDPSTVGVNETFGKSEFKLYPNPSHDIATLSWGDNITVDRIDIISISGQYIEALRPQYNKAQISGLPSGVYILQISNAKESQSVKMIVE